MLTFINNGDGKKGKQVSTANNETTTTYYFTGGTYEMEVVGTQTTVTQYYSIGGVSVGMRKGETFSYFLTDHLGSVVGTTDEEGVLTSETRYTPFGEVRTDVGEIDGTDYGYTFQKVVSGSGLMDYKARMYDTFTGRFIQPDTLVPEPGSSQGYNRYAYTNNNPINRTDPSGHKECDAQNDGRASCIPNITLPAKYVFPSRNNIYSNAITLPSTFVDGEDTKHNNGEDIKKLEDLKNWNSYGSTLLDTFENVANFGQPLYKHLKGAIPGGVPEGIIGGIIQFEMDSTLPFGQRLLRASLIGLEDVSTDAASSAFAGDAMALVGGVIGCAAASGLGCAVGLGVGFVAGSVVATELIDNYFWDRINKEYLGF
ncbi:hypothetical protein SDC9_81905 [bioreactor metagenome]|uniref:Teneurin-like YD-shell domain-containing protein n=1 Tax=bioreactor metagenome TaxID=1076179 RepID=A0A644Z318_9ZZZZ